jgi:endonuclease/exonuclease/phosphatase family metal-dependent hydrolase
MAGKFRTVTRRLFLAFTIILVIIFLLSCLAPYLNPRNWWVISFLGIGFPILLFLVIITFAGWLIVLLPRYALIPGIALLISIPSIRVFLGFHSPGTFSEKKKPESLRVMSWNVARFIELKKNKNRGSRVRENMFELIRKQNADILCLQEFHTSIHPDYYNNIDAVKALGYPYFYFTYDLDGDAHYYSSIIFSKFPIIDSGLIRYPRPTLPDALIHADIKVGTDTFRVYTTHMQSIQFGKSDYERMREIRAGDDSIMQKSRSLLAKIKRGFTHRSIQADMIAEVTENSPHPVIFCADLNDIPNSYAYHTVRGGMQDAFLKKGFGIGRTFSGIFPTLRIDYIFADDAFRVEQFSRILKRHSDHYPILADLSFEKDK